MRSLLYPLAGLLQLGVACALAAIAWQLPGGDDVEEAAGRVEKVSRAAAGQARSLDASLARARERQPKLLALARSLDRQMKVVAPLQKDRSGGDALEGLSRALVNIAAGLEGLKDTLAPESAEHLGKGLGATA